MSGAGQLDRIDPTLLAAAQFAPLGLSNSTLPAIRASLDGRRADAARRMPTGAVSVRTEAVTLGSRQVAVRWYRTSPDRAAPTLVYLHSGGYVLGNLDTDHRHCLALAERARCTVVSVDYRLAPEHPFPAARDDVLGVLAALRADPGRYAVNGERLAIGGSSAGAGLAAAVALALSDTDAPALRLQLLHQPMLDPRCATASMFEFDATPAFDSGSARAAWRMYLDHDHAAATVLDRAGAAQAESLAGLPPAHVSASEIDPLRDEAIEYASRLLAAGVSTELHVYPGTCHGFALMAPEHPRSVEAVDSQVAALIRAFG